MVGGRNAAPNAETNGGSGRKKRTKLNKKTDQAQLGKYEYTVYGTTGTGEPEKTSKLKETPRMGGPRWRGGAGDREGGGGARRRRRRGSGGVEEYVGEAAEHADVEPGALPDVVIGDVDAGDRANGVGAGRRSGKPSEKRTIQGRWGRRVFAAGARAGANGHWQGEREWGRRLLQAGWQSTVWWDIESIADVGQEAENLPVSRVVG